MCIGVCICKHDSDRTVCATGTGFGMWVPGNIIENRSSYFFEIRIRSLVNDICEELRGLLKDTAEKLFEKFNKLILNNKLFTSYGSKLYLHALTKRNQY